MAAQVDVRDIIAVALQSYEEPGFTIRASKSNGEIHMTLVQSNGIEHSFILTLAEEGARKPLG